MNPCMEFMDFERATSILVCNWIFQNSLGGWKIQRAFQQAITWEILTLPPHVMSFLFFVFT